MMRKNHNIIVIYFLNVIIYLFALCYPHMNSQMFWYETFAYFYIGSLGNNFIVSTELGLMWLAIPICALIGVDASEARQRLLKSDTCRYYTIHVCKNILFRVILPFVVSIGIFCLVLSVSSRAGTTGSWQITAIKNAYKWRAENEFIWVYIIEFIVRVSIALIFWSMVNVTLLLITNQKSTVCIYILIINILTNLFFGYMGRPELSVANLEIPSVASAYPLKEVTKGLLIYLAIGVSIYVIFQKIIFKMNQRQKNETREKNISLISNKNIDTCCLVFAKM